MDERAFLESRKSDWDRLTRMLEQASRDLSRLSVEELGELGRLYRLACSDLALAIARQASPELILYLNGLVGRAHGIIYGARERDTWKATKNFLLGGFANVARAKWAYILAAAILFFVPFLYAFVYVLRNGEGSELWFRPGGRLPVTPDPAIMSSFIMTNNIGVAFGAFAGGVTFGALTAFSLAYNGVVIGQVSGTVTLGGRGMDILAFVLPHGVIELAAIFIAGGAGLMMGTALIRPGNLTRKDSLKLAARPAVRLVGGVVIMLVIAAVIEGFLSPSQLPAAGKIAFGGATAILLLLYFIGCGRQPTA